MGVEQGGDYFDSGGGGGDSYGGGYDLGGDFVYGYGAGGGDFVLDPGFMLPDNVSEGGDAIAWGFDTTSWPTLDDIGAGADFNYGYGAGTGGDLGPVADSVNWGNLGIDVGGGYIYDPVADQFIDTGLEQPTGGSDLYGAYLDYYMNQGYDFYEASAMASQEAAQGSILTPTLEQGAPPVLPDLPVYYPLPYVDNWDPYQTPPYIPTFPDLPPPPPPAQPATQKLGPCNTVNGLPGYCAAGTYHPANDPCSCVPFPAATTNAPKPPTGTSSAPPPAPKPSTPPKPPTQPSCPPGQARNPATGQCQTPMPTPRCPTGYTYNPTYQRCLAASGQTACPTGYVWDARISRCVAQLGMPNLLPGPGDFIQPGLDSTLGDLANLPWWLWAALGGLLLLNTGGSKTTTVRYRRG